MRRCPPSRWSAPFWGSCSSVRVSRPSAARAAAARLTPRPPQAGPATSSAASLFTARLLWRRGAQGARVRVCAAHAAPRPGLSLLIMIVSAVMSGMTFGPTTDRKAVIGTLCFFRFFLGFGARRAARGAGVAGSGRRSRHPLVRPPLNAHIPAGVGGDYPLSSVIMSEYSSKVRAAGVGVSGRLTRLCAAQFNRGAFVGAVFAMQGMGILCAAAVGVIVSAIFNSVRRKRGVAGRERRKRGRFTALLTHSPSPQNLRLIRTCRSAARRWSPSTRRARPPRTSRGAVRAGKDSLSSRSNLHAGCPQSCSRSARSRPS